MEDTLRYGTLTCLGQEYVKACCVGVLWFRVSQQHGNLKICVPLLHFTFSLLLSDFSATSMVMFLIGECILGSVYQKNKSKKGRYCGSVPCFFVVLHIGYFMH